MRGTGARGVCGRAGFTLVELLVTVAIIAILAGVGLSTLFLAQEAAREDRTRMLISKLHNQLMIRWESYQTRRLPLQIGNGKYLDGNGNSQTVPSNETPEQFAWRLLWARRELMRFEMPDFYGDIWDYNAQPIPTTRKPALLRLPGENATDDIEIRPHERYLRRIARMLNSYDPANDGYPLAQDMERIRDKNQEAECLYLVVTGGMEVDASGKKIFDERHVGDTDEDGMPEFVDGWGEPIRWIRWPAGFVSDLQPFDANSSTPRNPQENHDPFDPRQIDDGTVSGAAIPPVTSGWPTFSPNPGANALTPPERGYRLYPLIVSAGPDGSFALVGLKEEKINPVPVSPAFRPYVFLDPYGYYEVDSDPSGPRRQRGEPVINDSTRSHLDNIHNHDLMGR